LIRLEGIVVGDNAQPFELRLRNQQTIEWIVMIAWQYSSVPGMP
jgi:hypothetical protein